MRKIAKGGGESSWIEIWRGLLMENFMRERYAARANCYFIGSLRLVNFSTISQSCFLTTHHGTDQNVHG